MLNATKVMTFQQDPLINVFALELFVHIASKKTDFFSKVDLSMNDDFYQRYELSLSCNYLY